MRTGFECENRRGMLAGRVFAVLLAVLVSGCSNLVSSAASKFADDLGQAVLNQPDPEIVRDGMPSYLLLIDSRLEANPDDAGLLAAAADLYAAYGAVFARDAQRASILTQRALNYAERAICIELERGCEWPNLPFDEFEQSLTEIDEDNARYASSYAVASLAYIRAHSDDWGSLARLPHIESLLLKILPFAPDADAGTLYSYLGILNTLRPPALGGQPELGREYFEKAIALTDGRDLSIKVEFARGYARLLYDQLLHDELLNEVLDASPKAPGLTLTNTLAQKDAAMLLQTGADYF